MSATAPPRRNARYTPLEADGPLPLDMIRSVPAIMRDPLRWMEQLVARHGDIVALPMPRTPVLLVNDPAAARRVLQENHRAYGKDTIQYGALSLVTGAGLLSADGDHWRSQRRLVQPAFHHGTLDGVAEHSIAAGRELREEWLAAGTLDVDAAGLRATLGVVGHSLLGSSFTRESADRVVHAVDEALKVVLARARSPLVGPLAKLPTPSRFRLHRSLRVLDDVCAELIARRRAQPGSDGDDLLGLLLAAGIDDREVRDELVTLVIAGHETVASALTWTLHLLAGAPQVQDRLQRELATVTGPAGARGLGWADLPRLPWTRAVIEEALRLYPPAWVITRRAMQDDVLAGVPVPAGTLVILSTWLLHRRPDDWREPETFDPARFLDAGRKAAYLPFGAGPRQCIGRDFALVEATLMLAALLPGVRVERPPGAPADPKVDALVTLRPRNGLTLTLTPQLAAHLTVG